MLASSLIDSKKWSEAKYSLNPFLEHRPPREVCILMSKIEEGETNNPQKINAWVSRSNFGELNKIWICRISNVSQNEWAAVSDSGYFNSLEWSKPALPVNVSSSIESLMNFVNAI